MILFRFIGDEPAFDFMRLHRLFFVFSLILILSSVGLFLVRGLNLGIDFLGGTLMEVETHAPADLASLRNSLESLNLGEITLQQFGAANIVLVRFRDQGDELLNSAAVGSVKEALGGVVREYRRTETVGPTIGGELRVAAIWAVSLAMLGMLVYIWFRFEWQFGLAALVALFHDVVSTIGLFSLLGLEFNLATVAALLTISGYSINDTVVIFDRVRENLVKYRKEALSGVLNMSINRTLSRTFMTSFTTLVAVLGLAIFGGAIIRDFAIALAWGVMIGTYSSICLASPLLLYMGLHRGDDDEVSGRVEA